MKKTRLLKQLLQSEQIEFLMEAHNGLSAQIAQEAGFQGIWASGLAISSALGVRDHNELSWSQTLDICEYIVEATSIPVLLDADTGYGNFNNFRRLVKKCERRDIAGVCLEDKLFPKTNSFIEHPSQALAAVEEMTGKIKSAKDTQQDSDFVVVARTESFIVGQPLEEALFRAQAYQQAGADAVLIHSKQNNSDEIDQFMQQWDRSCPVIVVPTKYYKTSIQHLSDIHISVVIWANHLIRSAITAMSKTAKEIYQKRSLITVEEKIAPLEEVFRLQNMAELKQAEERYLPKKKG